MKKKNPYDKNIIKKCDVCEKMVLVDQYGNGFCENCGWEQCIDILNHPDIVTYPNLVSLNKAKERYSQDKPFTPSFEDFIDGLFMYSEMQFEYDNILYGVLYFKNKKIVLYEYNNEDSEQVYYTKKDFINKSHIKGNLLKDIWKDVKNADYMHD